MNRKTRRQLLILLVVLAVLASACIGLWAWSRAREAAENAAAENAGISLQLPQDLSSLTWGTSETTFSFEAENGRWYWAEDHDFPLLSSEIEVIAQCLESLTAARTLDVPEDLSDYGLNDPETTVEITLSNAGGETQTLLLGTSVGENYYAMKPDGDRIYVLGSTLASYLSVSLYDLADTDILPSVTQDTVQAITVSGTQESVLTVASNTDAEGNVSYTWTCNGRDISGTDLISALRAEFENIDFYQLGGFKEDDSLLEACGLKDPITVTLDYLDADGSAAQEQLLIGAVTEDGNYYYASPDGGISIFYLACNSVDSLVALAEGGQDHAAAALENAG